MDKDKHPSAAECMELLDRYRTPPHVQRHCIAVANVAVAVARSLNENGFELSLPLIRAAGLLHDIARVQEEHWNRGADFALQLGFCEEANIIRGHMFHSFPREFEALSEVDMVCLGDRLVKENEFVGLDVRMDYILSKAAYSNRNVQQIIREEMERTRCIIRQIELLVGTSLTEIVTDTQSEHDEPAHATK